MNYKSVNIEEKLKLFSDLWSPRIIAEMNDYQFKLVKFQGEFVWHTHEETDETFMVVKGAMTIEFRDSKVDLKEGEMFVVPKGVEHRPFAEKECSALVIEPKGVVNTGEAGGEKTAENDVWI